MKIVLEMSAITSNVIAGESLACSFSWYECYILKAFFPLWKECYCKYLIAPVEPWFSLWRKKKTNQRDAEFGRITISLLQTLKK